MFLFGPGPLTKLEKGLTSIWPGVMLKTTHIKTFNDVDLRNRSVKYIAIACHQDSNETFKQHQTIVLSKMFFISLVY